MQHLLDLNRLLVKMSDVLLIGLDFILNTTKYTNVQTKKKKITKSETGIISN